MFDAYVRMIIDDLQALVPKHLHSETDPDGPDLDADELAGRVQGFTEWTIAGPRWLSLGWDWTFDVDSRLLLAQWNTLRTNLMVTNEAGDDMGADCTRLCIARLMARVHWEHTTAQVLGLRLQH